MSKTCLVVPRSVLEQQLFWNRLGKVEGVINSVIPLSENEISDFISLVGREAKFMERFGSEGIEFRPEWQQITLYALVVKGDKFFIYKRGGEGSGAADKRLHSKLSAGIGGHIEPFDSGLVDSLYREIGEELAFTENGTEVSFDGNIKILGLIKSDADEVSQVHTGLAAIAVVKNQNFEIKIKGDESVDGWLVNSDEFQQLRLSNDYDIEHWTDLLLEIALPEMQNGVN